MRIRFRSNRAAALSGVAAGLIGSAAPLQALADVQSSSPAGFVVRIEVPIAAPPADVHAKVFEIGRWWSDDHTYTGKASNMTLKNEPGGCFCEALPGGFIRHAALEYSDKGKVIRLSGALGPLQELGAQGMLSFNFLPADKAGTRLVVSYAVGGYPAGDKGLAALAGVVNDVLNEQVQRLKRFTETGKGAP